MTGAPKLCANCGATIPGGALFCLACGQSSPTEIASTVPGSTPPPMRPTIDIPGRLVEVQAALGHGFTVQGLIGRGGFGEVWSAMDLQLGRTVAIKVLRSELFETPAYRERFRREARAIAKLRHPGIVPVYHVGESNGLAYFVMPMVDGVTLKTRLADPVTPDEALRIFTEAVAALREAHASNIIHRDLKPENIMLEGPQRRVLLMDFGVAKTDEPDQGGDGLTEADTVLGSPEYMSPEQATGRALDARSDIYSLGVVAYRMFAGRLPFRAETPREVLAHHVLTEPQPISEVAHLPPGVAEIVMKCLTKDPGARWTTADQLLEALTARDLRRSIVAATGAERREPREADARARGEARERVPLRRRPAFVIGMVFLGLLVVLSPWPIGRWRAQRRGDVAAQGIGRARALSGDSLRKLGDLFGTGSMSGPAYAAAREEVLLADQERIEAAFGSALDDSLRWRVPARRAVTEARARMLAAAPAADVYRLRASDVPGCRMRQHRDTLEMRDEVARDNCWFQMVAARYLTAPVEYFATFSIVDPAADAGIGLAWCRNDADCRVAFFWSGSPVVWGRHRPHSGLDPLRLGNRIMLPRGRHELRARFQNDVLRIWFDGTVVLNHPAAADAAWLARPGSGHVVGQHAGVIIPSALGLGAAGTPQP